jgi:hypothetical protein
MISGILSDHNGIKLEINKRKNGKYASIWGLKNTLLSGQWSLKKSEEILKLVVSNENENTTYQKLWDATKAF